MRRQRYIFSVILLLAMFFSFIGLDTGTVNADELSFPNIGIDGDGILGWDVDDDTGNMSYSFYVNDKKSFPDYDHDDYLDREMIDVRRSLIARNMPAGTYALRLEAEDLKGNHYLWNGSYTLVSKKIKLPSVSNIRWEGDYIVWDYDSTNVPEKTLFEVCFCRMKNGIVQSSNFGRAHDNRICTKGYVFSGTYDYSVFIQASYNNFDYADSDEVRQDFYGVTAEPNKLTGLKYEDGILSWDAVPGAADYDVTISTSVNPGEYRFKYPKTNQLNIAELYGNQPQTLDISVGAIGRGRSGYNDYWYMTRSAGITVDYDFQGYALSVFGKRVDLSSDLNDVLGDGGSISYDPLQNKLVLDQITDDDVAKLDRNIYNTGSVMFDTKGSLTVEGSANLHLDSAFMNVGLDLTFVPGCSMNIESGNSNVISARNVWFQGGKYVFRGNGEPTLSLGHYITISDGTQKLVVENASSGKAMDCGLVNPDGKITIPDSMKIYIPENGRIRDDLKTIVDRNNNAASKVIISTEKYAPSPTATPTAKPTVEPTVEPTVKPTGKPVVKPASKPTGKPVMKPTTAPSVTPKAKPTSAPQVITPKPAKVPAAKKTQILSFVERLYSCVLGREPERDGAEFWSDELYGFRRTGAEVAQGFIFSPEFENRNTTDEQFVTILYNTFFDRAPEEEGLSFWLSQLSSGSMDRSAVASGFIYSQEWADTCASYGIRSGGSIEPSVEIAPSKATLAFVKRMYTTAMERESDASGLEFWSRELSNFRFSGEQVGAVFFLSEEMQGAGLSDDEFVTRLYATFMDRSPDDEGLSFWVDVLGSGSDRASVVFGFTRSPEFTEKCIEARILPY